MVYYGYGLPIADHNPSNFLKAVFYTRSHMSLENIWYYILYLIFANICHIPISRVVHVTD